MFSEKFPGGLLIGVCTGLLAALVSDSVILGAVIALLVGVSLGVYFQADASFPPRAEGTQKLK